MSIAVEIVRSFASISGTIAATLVSLDRALATQNVVLVGIDAPEVYRPLIRDRGADDRRDD